MRRTGSRRRGSCARPSTHDLLIPARARCGAIVPHEACVSRERRARAVLASACALPGLHRRTSRLCWMQVAPEQHPLSRAVRARCTGAAPPVVSGRLPGAGTNLGAPTRCADRARNVSRATSRRRMLARAVTFPCGSSPWASAPCPRLQSARIQHDVARETRKAEHHTPHGSSMIAALWRRADPGGSCSTVSTRTTAHRTRRRPGCGTHRAKSTVRRARATTTYARGAALSTAMRLRPRREPCFT